MKAVKDAFGLSDNETPPPSLVERLKGKSKQESVLKFQKNVLILDPQTWMMMSWRQWWLYATSKL